MYEAYEAIRTVARIVLHAAFRYRIIDLHKVPSTGPLIVASNHVSGWDPLVVGCALNRPIAYMAKEELFHIPVVKHLLPKMCVFPVKRGKADRSAVKKALETLREGGALGIFPEGTRIRDNQSHEPFPGVAYFANKTGAVVIPAGTGYSGDYPRLTCTVRFGDPVPMGAAGEKVDTETLQERSRVVMEAVRRLITPGGETK